MSSLSMRAMLRQLFRERDQEVTPSCLIGVSHGALIVTVRVAPVAHVRGDPMPETAEYTVIIRQIQGLTALLSCLPPGGKARELFALALALDEGPWLDKIGPPADPDSDEGMKAWLESLWAEGDITPEEQQIIDWQGNSDNMTAAISEFQDVSAKLTPA
jgi:Family of unknown function (DUF5950)